MAVKKILTGEKNEKLRKISKPVENIDKKILKLLDDMKNTMKKSDGIGLAAPQVGVLKRVVVVDFGQGVIELINPKIVKTLGRQEEEEGCLSVPDRRGLVKRPLKLWATAYDREGNLMKYTGEGVMPRVFAHEIDHLNGILFTDKMTKEVFEEKK